MILDITHHSAYQKLIEKSLLTCFFFYYTLQDIIVTIDNKDDILESLMIEYYTLKNQILATSNNKNLHYDDLKMLNINIELIESRLNLPMLKLNTVHVSSENLEILTEIQQSKDFYSWID